LGGSAAWVAGWVAPSCIGLLARVAPWEVSRVELSVVDSRVDVWAEYSRRTGFACPDCARELAVYDHSEERAWRHLDSCGFLIYLYASPPRVDCPEHGVPEARLPWAEPRSRFTVLFERLAIDVLQESDVTGTGGCCSSVGMRRGI
jgi:transposase